MKEQKQINYKLIRISAPYFCAGAEIDHNNNVINAAPILKWMKGRNLWWIEKYCNKKKWEIEVI